MKWLTPQEAAERARVSRSLSYARCEELRLAHVRAGGAGRRGRILIDEDDLNDLLKSLRVAAAEGGEAPPLKHIRLS